MHSVFRIDLPTSSSTTFTSSCALTNDCFPHGLKVSLKSVVQVPQNAVHCNTADMFSVSERQNFCHQVATMLAHPVSPVHVEKCPATTIQREITREMNEHRFLCLSVEECGTEIPQTEQFRRYFAFLDRGFEFMITSMTAWPKVLFISFSSSCLHELFQVSFLFRFHTRRVQVFVSAQVCLVCSSTVDCSIASV